MACAQTDEDRFVEANLLSIFYHEMGHAMIDVLRLPVFGQEEDAADVASILMIDGFYDEEVAQDLAYDAAFGFWALGAAQLADRAQCRSAARHGLKLPDPNRLPAYAPVVARLAGTGGKHRLLDDFGAVSGYVETQF